MSESVQEAFNRALVKDAATAPPSVPGPPRVTKTKDPAAPFGRAKDTGEAIAPYGRNPVTGKVYLNNRGQRPAGFVPPAKVSKQDKPRVTDAVPPPSDKAVPSVPKSRKDYTDDLAGLATTVWMGAASIRFTQPYAALFRESSGGMVKAWNDAAQQNKEVRRYVEKFSGEGSYAWVIALAVTTAPFVGACLELAKREPDPQRKAQKAAYKDQLAAQTQHEFKEFIEAQMAAAMPQAEQHENGQVAA